MKIAVLIPSRYGSTRFEGKPLALIAGKPMIQRVYEQAQKARGVDQVAVATDDERIKTVVEEFGGRVIMTAEAHQSGTDRLAEAAQKAGYAPEDIIVNVQGDQPLLHPGAVEDVIRPFQQDSSTEMSTLAFLIGREDEITNPTHVKVTFSNKGDALYFSRSPIPFGRDAGMRFDTYKHLGIYAYTRRFIEIFSKLPEGRLEQIEKLEQLRALEHGHTIKVAVTTHDSPEVDVPGDVARIESILAKCES